MNMRYSILFLSYTRDKHARSYIPTHTHTAYVSTHICHTYIRRITRVFDWLQIGERKFSATYGMSFNESEDVFACLELTVNY